MSTTDGEFNRSTQHLLILPDEEVCERKGMHGRRNRARSIDRSAFPERFAGFATRLFTRKANVFQQMIVQLGQRPSLAAAHDPNGYCPD